MTLNYAYVIKTVIFVPTPHHSRINSEPLTPCKNIPKPQKGRQGAPTARYQSTMLDLTIVLSYFESFSRVLM